MQQWLSSQMHSPPKDAEIRGESLRVSPLSYKRKVCNTVVKKSIKNHLVYKPVEGKAELKSWQKAKGGH